MVKIITIFMITALLLSMVYSQGMKTRNKGYGMGSKKAKSQNNDNQGSVSRKKATKDRDAINSNSKRARGQSNFDKNMVDDVAQIKKRNKRARAGIFNFFSPFSDITGQDMAKNARKYQMGGDKTKEMYQQGQQEYYEHNEHMYVNQQQRPKRAHQFQSQQQEKMFMLATIGTALLVTSLFLFSICQRPKKQQMSRQFLVEKTKKRKNF